MTIDRSRSTSPVALAIIVAVGMAIAVWVVLNSAFFAVRTVRVEGVRTLAAVDIRRLAQVEVGDNLIMLPAEEVAGRIEGDPWVLDANVERDLPNTLVISVTERRSAGWLDDPDGFSVLAGDGTILVRSESSPPRLPQLGSWPETLNPGDKVDALGASRRVASSMPRNLLHQIATVRAENSALTLELRSGASVLYGEPVDIDVKNHALGSMLIWAEEQGIAVRTVDVRVPSAPSLTPMRGDEVSPAIA